MGALTDALGVPPGSDDAKMAERLREIHAAGYALVHRQRLDELEDLAGVKRGLGPEPITEPPAASGL